MVSLAAVVQLSTLKKNYVMYVDCRASLTFNTAPFNVRQKVPYSLQSSLNYMYSISSQKCKFKI